MANGRATQEEVYDLFYFVALSGEAGRCWVGDYELTESNELKRLADTSLSLLHKRRFDDARVLLDRVEAHLQQMETESNHDSIRHVLGRWYYGTLAYYYYCLNEFNRASQLLAQAHESVKLCIELKPFLVSFAAHCSDLRLQHARVARAQKRWRLMQHHLEAVRSMIEGHLPFCTLTDGTPINLTTVREFYDSLPLNEKEKDSLNAFLDDDLRYAYFNQHINRVYVVPGVVIPYP